MEESLEELNTIRNYSNATQQQAEQINQEEDKFDLVEITISKETPEPVVIDGEK